MPRPATTNMPAMSQKRTTMVVSAHGQFEVMSSGVILKTRNVYRS